jgi:hypothetical protein
VIPLSPGKAADSSLLSAVAGMGIAPKLLAPPNTNPNPKGSDSVSESSSSVTQETNGTGKFHDGYVMLFDKQDADNDNLQPHPPLHA